MARQFPSVLKPIQPYLRVSKQFETKDPVVAYYVSMYAIQEGITLSKSDPAAKDHLLIIMDQLGKMKELHKERLADAVSNDVVAQAHVEVVAFKLFDFADKEDRAANFNKNMIKAFFTASHLFMTLKQFGELSEEVSEKMKYAKWKAVEIDRCLKNGITPTPGPPGEQEREEDEFGDDQGGAGASGFSHPPPYSYDAQPGPSSYSQLPTIGFGGPPPTDSPYPPADSYPSPQPRHALPPDIKPVPKPRGQDHQPSEYHQDPSGFQHDVPTTPGGAQLGPEEMQKAQKLCKFASSALEYDDVEGAIDFLQKATRLLKTGKE